MVNKLTVSIIIVHYKNNKDLFECLESLYKHNKGSFEVIVVDNSEKKSIKNLLISRYKNLKYIPSKVNIGYGAGINLGAKQAKGDYIFILNPDTIFESNVISNLLIKIKKDKNIAIVAPILYTTENKIMEQGARDLTPLRAIFQLSFIKKIWPGNPFGRNYWVRKWKANSLNKVDNVPGTAFLIRKDIFDRVGGFDEKYFLYFEEFDLCKRVRKLGYRLYIDSSSKLIHKWETTTKLLVNKDEIFKRSRFYYFKKNFGFINAIIVEFFLRLNISVVFLLTVALFAIIIRLYKIDEFVPFYGDIGWFFISARDILLNNNVPLVGITSSHVWLHQGPLWTYIVSLLFYVYNFNPIAPYYFTAILDVFTLLFIYKFCLVFFSKRTAMFASLVYGFSPAIILSARTAYHTSLIPFFVCFFLYCLYKWVAGKPYYLPLVFFSVAILYNLELQTFVFTVFLLLILIYGYFKKTLWWKRSSSLKIALLSVFSLAFPMIPILIYDLQNGFPQTLVFTGWLIYKFVNLSNIFSNSGGFEEVISYLIDLSKMIIFIPNTYISGALALIIIGFITVQAIRKKFVLLFASLIFPLLSILLNKTPSDAYTMSLFVPFVISTSLLLDFITRGKQATKIIYLVVVLACTVNSFYLLKNNYYIGFANSYGPSMIDRVKVAKYMMSESNGRPFKILGKGEGSEFESFVMNYQYLTWYIGAEPSNSANLLFVIKETPNDIKIVKYK